MKIKKVLLSVALGTIILGGTTNISAETFNNSTNINSKKTEEPIIIGGEVGDIIKVGDLIFEILQNDPEITKDNLISKSTEGYDVILDNNTSLSKDFNLAGDYKYWKVWVQNTGKNKIVVSTMLDGKADPSPVIVEGYVTTAIYTTKPVKSGTYVSSFTSGAGMKGKAACRIATSLSELDA